MTVDLTRAKEIVAAATPGPWRHEMELNQIAPTIFGSPEDPDEDDCVCQVEYLIEDAEFICFARTFIPEAIEEIERLRDLVAVRTDSWMNATDALVDQKAYLKIAETELAQVRKRLELADAVCRAVEETMPSGWSASRIEQVALEAWRQGGGG